MRGRVGPFEVVRPLGQGAMGSVYEVRLPGDPRRLAAKFCGLAREAAHMERFRREGELLAKLRHPGILRVHSAGALDDGTPWLVFDLVEGRSLDEVLAEEGPLDEDRAVDLGLQLAQALAHAHAHGVVHRDVKPANVLVDGEGRLLLADFGIALGADADRLTRTGQMVGSPAYMAPEQASGSKAAGPWTDVHAVGVLLHEALVGEPPFEGSNLQEVLARTLRAPPPSIRAQRPELSAGLDALVARCLAKDPEDRYADAGELAQDMARVARREQIAGGRRRGPGLALAVAALVILAVAGAVWLTHEPEQGPAAEVETAPEPETPATNPDRVQLAWKLRDGDRFRCYVKIEDEQRSQGGGNHFLSKWWGVQRIDSRVGDRVQFSVTIQRFLFEIETTVMATKKKASFSFDSRLSDEDQNSLLTYLRAFEGHRYRFEVDLATNEVLTMSGFDELTPVLHQSAPSILGDRSAGTLSDAVMRRHFTLAWCMLPTKPVAVGESWEVTVRPRKLPFTRRCTLESSGDGRSVIRTLVTEEHGANRLRMTGKVLWQQGYMRRATLHSVREEGDQPSLWLKSVCTLDPL